LAAGNIEAQEHIKMST